MCIRDRFRTQSQKRPPPYGNRVDTKVTTSAQRRNGDGFFKALETLCDIDTLFSPGRESTLDLEEKHQNATRKEILTALSAHMKNYMEVRGMRTAYNANCLNKRRMPSEFKGKEVRGTLKRYVYFALNGTDPW